MSTEVADIAADVDAALKKKSNKGSTKPEKKKPGRPRKKITNISTKLYGIVDTPHNAEHAVEVVYENPRIFKKLFSMDKMYNVNEISMAFNPTSINISTKSHLGNVHIFSDIDCTWINHYYCREPINVKVKREDLSEIFSSFDKNHYKITILLRNENVRSKMFIIVRDGEMDNDLHFDLDLITGTEQNEIDRNKFDFTKYPIKFSLPGKHIKKVINDISKVAKIFSIQKNGTEPLNFAYELSKKPKLCSIYRNAEKIKLNSTLEPDDFFSVSMAVNSIKPFTSSNLGDEITIYADKYRPIALCSDVDIKEREMNDGSITRGYVCRVRIFADIQKYIDDDDENQEDESTDGVLLG